MRIASASWCRTTATDARKFYYNADYIDNLTLEETQFMLAHEAMHCALSHFARRGHRIKMRWDLACDYAINPLLVKDGLTPPPNTMMMREYEGMTAEEIYPLIDENDNNEPLDHHLYDDEHPEGDNDTGKSDMPPPPDMEDQEQKQDKSNDEQGDGGQAKQQANDNSDRSKPQPGEDTDQKSGSQPRQSEQGRAQQQGQTSNNQSKGAPKPQPLTESEKSELAVQWQQRLAGAAQQAMQSGKLGGEMARMVDFLLQPQLPWRMLLARYMNSLARDDYSYTRPSTRRGDPAIYPSLRSAQVNVVIALDTSGSISEKEIQEFVSEIDAVKGQMRARITLIACDSQLAEGCPWEYEAWDEFVMPERIKGGGGTDFQPVFEWAERQDRTPELLIYFTDAEGAFPDYEPAFPVLWLIKGKAKVPWGQRIQLN